MDKESTSLTMRVIRSVRMQNSVRNKSIRIHVPHCPLGLVVIDCFRSHVVAWTMSLLLLLLQQQQQQQEECQIPCRPSWPSAHASSRLVLLSQLCKSDSLHDHERELGHSLLLVYLVGRSVSSYHPARLSTNQAEKVHVLGQWSNQKKQEREREQ